MIIFEIERKLLQVLEVFNICGLNEYLDYDEKLQERLFKNFVLAEDKKYEKMNFENIKTEEKKNHLELLNKKRERKKKEEKVKLTKEEYIQLVEKMKNKPKTKIVFKTAPQVVQFNFN